MNNTFKNAWNGTEHLRKVWRLIGVPLGLLFILPRVPIMGPAYSVPLRAVVRMRGAV
ncbi:hypothetical protein [Burkholderia latens]|uniref:hypothetical protein n=1 Tax=Burkholderia latens TaxID=488446 RepID=UPI00158C3DFB|nr:hypothetical protein [Burkholderia latens]